MADNARKRRNAKDLLAQWAVSISPVLKELMMDVLPAMFLAVEDWKAILSSVAGEYELCEMK